jgi:hypothetical protein
MYPDQFLTASTESPDERHQKIKEMAYWRWRDQGGDADENYRWAENAYDQQLAARTQTLKKYAVVTRRQNPRTGRAITLIGRNHGRAAQGIVEFLLREHEGLSKLVNTLIAPSGLLPVHFQILFDVTVSRTNGEVEPEGVEYVTHRVIQHATPSTSTVIDLLEQRPGEREPNRRPPLKNQQPGV